MGRKRKDTFSGELFPAPEESPFAPEEMDKAAEALAASAEDTPLGEPPPENEGDEWREAPKKEPYAFGERIHKLDMGRLVLCPECGAKFKGKRPSIGFGEMKFTCSADSNHRWIFVADKDPASEGGVVKNLNEQN